MNDLHVFHPRGGIVRDASLEKARMGLLLAAEGACDWLERHDDGAKREGLAQALRDAVEDVFHAARLAEGALAPFLAPDEPGLRHASTIADYVARKLKKESR